MLQSIMSLTAVLFKLTTCFAAAVTIMLRALMNKSVGLRAGEEEPVGLGQSQRGKVAYAASLLFSNLIYAKAENTALSGLKMRPWFLLNYFFTRNYCLTNA